MAECKQSLEQLAATHFDASTHICIQYFGGLIPEETLWKDPKIEKLENVVSKRLTTDPKGKLRRRVIVNFKDENSAMIAAEQLHKKEICGIIVKTFVIYERIGRLKIKKGSSLTEVFVCGLDQKTSSEDLVKLLAQFKSIEYFDIIEDRKDKSTGCAVIKFRNLREAYEAEFALHGRRVNEKILSLTVRRKKSQTVTIPWRILEIVIKNQIREGHHAPDGSSRAPQAFIKNDDFESKLPKTDLSDGKSCITEESEVKGQSSGDSRLNMFYSNLLVSAVEAVKEENRKSDSDNKESNESSEFELVDPLSKSQHVDSEPMVSRGGGSDRDSASTSKVSGLKSSDEDVETAESLKLKKLLVSAIEEVEEDGSETEAADESCEHESDSDIEVLDRSNPDLSKHNLLSSLDLQDDV